MERNLRKERIGVVVSNKMDKSVVVAVATMEKHPVYGKFVKKNHGDPSFEQDKEMEISRNRRKS